MGAVATRAVPRSAGSMIATVGIATRLGSGVYVEVIFGCFEAQSELNHSSGEQEKCGETHLVGITSCMSMNCG